MTIYDSREKEERIICTPSVSYKLFINKALWIDVYEQIYDTICPRTVLEKNRIIAIYKLRRITFP